ncbi:MAG: ORF6N domain-containing protein [Bacteroidales bacterium]|nr:ORF6N domain-containing protein [Bacteroidales bacterium]
MENELLTTNDFQVDTIKNRIYEVRGQRIMLDSDLAELYEVEVSQLKRQVRRNIDRFPEDFMFELTRDEYESLRCQNGTIKNGRGQHSKYLPFAFTEEGIAMLSGMLKSKTAIQVNINIMRAFVAIRHAVASMQLSNLHFEQLSRKIDHLNAYIEEILHDQNDINDQQEQTNNEVALQIEAINDALDQLREKNIKPRNTIGFKTKYSEL